MNRRTWLKTVAGGLATSFLAKHPSVARTQSRYKIGIVLYCLGRRLAWENLKKPSIPFDDPIRFLDHCHDLGAGGVQVPLRSRTKTYTQKLRSKVEAYGMFLDAVGTLPRDQNDLARFESEVQTARRAGADIMRVVMMPGRRYERYATLDEFNRLRKQGIQSVEWAEPIVRKHGLKLAIENHKVQRMPEFLEVLQHISSEYVGVCVDTGNSFALLEDPIEVAKAYAPWGLTVHFKDQALAEYEDGFLFADVKYGEGFIDLVRVADILRNANPDIHFNVEMITRDPLKISCLTEQYWATMGDCSGKHLARALRTVRRHTSKTMPSISALPLEKQVAVEEDNVLSSLAYAKKHCSL